METLKLEIIKHNNFKLLKSVKVNVYNIPEGFVTYFASVPRIFRPIIPKMGKYNHASLLHDYLLKSNEKRSFLTICFMKQ